MKRRWQVLDVLAVSSEDTNLNTAEGGLVVVDGPRRKDSDKYVLTAQTFQRKVTGVRLDAFTDKDLPRKGPGLGGDGSFALGDFKIVAKPLDAASKEPSVTLKLKPVQAAFEEANQPLKFAVDDNLGTAWRANADGGKDNAALFEIEGGFPGFAAGAEWSVELKFAGPGLGRFRISVTTEPGTVTWAGESTPQHLGELKAILADNKNAIPEALREFAVRWFAPFDLDAQRLRLAVDEHRRARPRPTLAEVYSTVAGGQEVFLLKRGEVDNKSGKAEPGYLQVLSRSPTPGSGGTLPTKDPAASSVDPRVTLGRWMTDVEQGAGPLVARVMANRLWQHHFGEGIVRTPNDFGARRSTDPSGAAGMAGRRVRAGRLEAQASS